LPLHASWQEPLTRLLDSQDPATLEQSLAAVAAIKTDRFDKRLEAISADASQPVLVRVAALETLSDQSELSHASFKLLTTLLSEGRSPTQSARAAQMLGSRVRSAEQLRELAALLTTAGPLELRELIKPFERNQDPEVGRTFLASIESARSFLSLNPTEFSDVIKRYPPELLDLANPLLMRLRQRDAEQQQRLEQLLPIVTQGDARRGRAVFMSEKAKCSVCHRIGDEGGKIGPDLSRIGRIRQNRDLLEAIVFPSSSLVRDYEPFNIVLADGKVMSGLILGETKDTIALQQQIGEPVAISRKEIEEIVPSTISMMPNGLDQAITKDELADVIAFLKSLK
jgi:putative heme-binding domain-containing protein